jgi:hypothetical protein
LVWSVLMGLSGLAWAAAPTPLTPADRRAAEAEAAEAAAQATPTQMPTLDEGVGENSEGVVGVAGESVDLNKLAPGANSAKSERLMQAGDASGDLTGLRSVYDEREAELEDNTQDRFLDEVLESKTRQVESHRGWVENDAGIREAMVAPGNALDGVLDGQSTGTCQTTTTREPVDTSYTVWDEAVCERIVPNPMAATCTREYDVDTNVPVLDQNERALLAVTQVSNGSICSRTVTVDETRPMLSMDRIASLTMSNETGGLSCERNRWAEAAVSPVQRTRTQALPINQEMGGLSCSRERWAEPDGSVVSGSVSALLTVNQESGGLSCSRTIWPTTGSGSVSNQRGAVLSIDSQSPGNVASREITATAGSGNQAGTKTGVLSINAETGGLSCARRLVPSSGTSTVAGTQVGSLNVDNQTSGELCSRFVWKTTGTGSQSQNRSAVLNIDTQSEAMLCSRNRWVTGGSAAIGALDVSIPLPFDPGFTAPKTNFTVGLAPHLPPGATSLSAFSASVVNDYSGCFGWTLVTAPSLGNGWTMTYRLWVEDACAFGYPPDPIVQMTGTAFGSVKNWSIEESGNCAASGSSHCPATWACQQQAPTTINGIAVTAGEVGALSALYGGAPAACTSSTLSRVCSGTANSSTSVSIAGDLPGGTTGISGFSFNVSNPQPGVTVTLTQVPEAGNGWIASFNVARSNWAAGLQAPSITMNWTAGFATSALELRESGSCGSSGTANCPASWSCTESAPASASGISITNPEAQSLSPLYPGASNSTCTRASWSKSCAGSATQGTDLSIAASLPGNVSGVSNFSFVVQNPQAGVTVTLTQTPAAGNSWVARFDVVRSVWGPTAPVRPTITMSWDAQVPTSSVTVQDSGSCTDPGSSFCPTVWSCAVFAPTTVAGEPLSVTQAQSMAPLYPGAPSTCAEGHLSRVCSGSAVVGSTLGIGDVLPPGTESITGFSFTVDNPQAGVAVGVASEPSLANGWTATFNVTRTNWSTAPADPRVTLTWTAVVPSVSLGVSTVGNAGDAGTANCPTSWSCTQSAPQMINGVNVTPAMAATQAPLFPGAAAACTRGSLDRSCSGTAQSDTDVPIAAFLTAGTTSISSFGFTVTNPQAGVTVALLQTPAEANGWIARFRTSRTQWASQPAAPTVNMTWNDTVPSVSTQVQDTGNCADAGSGACPVSWVCTATAPTLVNGVSVTGPMASSHAPLFPGAGGNCVSASLSRTCSGTASNDTSVSIQAQLPGGTTSISNFRFTVRNPQAGVTVTVIQTPSQANNWVAILRTQRSQWASTPAQPDVLLEWDVPSTAVLFSVRDTGNCADPGSSVCPTQWSCAGSAPVSINGISVTPAMLLGETPLYGGADTACVRSELMRVCTGQATVGASIGVGDLIPGGATSIRGFTYTVENPQSGVTVTLIAAPSLANGWTATFDVVRTDFSVVPAPPEVRVDFEVDEASIALSVRDTGNCADTGSQACPTQWACSLMAPATVNGQSLTAAMVVGEPLLFAGADPACLTAQLSRVCTGTVTTGAQVPIGDLLPAGTTEILNFAWVQENTTPGVGVALVEAPTEANGWTASFSVTRDYTVGPSDAPSVRLTWNVYGELAYVVGYQDTGDCAAGAGQGGGMCRDEWVCDEWSQIPAHEDPLRQFWNRPENQIGEPMDPLCRRGRFERVCDGAGGSVTEVSIAHHLPVGTQAILNYRWSVANAVTDVAVAQLQAPELGNNWVARFETTRGNWTTTPSGQPEVLLEWQIEGDPNHSVGVVETGDCAAEGSEFCQPEWRCLENADDTPGTVTVTRTAMRSLAAPSTAGAVVNHVVVLASEIGQATSVSNFGAEVTAGGSVVASVTELPTQANGWTAQIQLEKLDIPGDVFQTVNVRLSWSSAEPSAQGGGVTAGMIAGAPPLYPGAPATCIRAERRMNCDGINEGEVCHDTVDGRWCETVSPGANNCDALAQNPRCELVRNECSEDGRGSDGHCYIENPVYRCSREIVGQDVVVRETTTCTGGAIPVCEGDVCTMQSENHVEEGQVVKSMAMLAVAETLRSDWKDQPVGGGGGAPPCGGPGCGGGGGPVIINSAKGVAKTATTEKGEQGPSLENVGGFDPWAMPTDGLPSSESDPAVANALMSAINPNGIRFFDGKQFNCMRALGGLLNCCTKQTPNQMNADWWAQMMEQMRKNWTGVGACATPGAADPGNAPGGGWEALGLNPSNASLNMGLTSLLENLNGGGSTPQCEGVESARMETVTDNFIQQAKTDIMPNLGWFCDEDEFELAAKKKLGNCHYLGTYCQSSVFGICIDRRQRHCCFNSPMSRMIRENLAEQGVARFGTAKRPTCQGISIADFAQLNPSDLDFEDIEGRMVESGVVGDWMTLNGQDLIERLTGSMSTIGNAGRLDVDERTLARLGGIDGQAVLDGVTAEVMATLPSTARPSTPTAGRISFVQGTVWAARGGRVEITVGRDGGQGAVSVRVVAVNGTAVQGTDFLLSAPITLSWGNGDTSARIVTLPALRTDPRTSVQKEFDLRLESPSGGASLGASSRAIVIVRPDTP